jgi:hypothetical protein
MDQLILEKALTNLEKNTGVRTDWEKYVKELNREIDANLVLHWNNNRIERYAEIKKEIRAHHIPQLKEMAKKYKNFLFIAERLYPTIKEKLNEEGIDWLDAAGNVHIKDKNLFLWIDHYTTTPTEKKKNRAFTKTGLKVVYLFLTEEKWLNKTHREIAEGADVALGNIKLVFNGLEQQGFLIQVDDKRKKLTKKAELMDQWMAGFIDELKPKIHKGNYRFRNRDLELAWKDLKLNGKAVWGGEPGADLLTNDLKPKQYLIYTHFAKAELMKTLGLVPDQGGPIEVYEPYWKMEAGNKQVAPPLTVYFDLKVTGEARNTKIAKEIYERFLAN